MSHPPKSREPGANPAEPGTWLDGLPRALEALVTCWRRRKGRHRK